MSTFATTGPLVRFTDTDGDVSFTATSPRVTFTAGYQSVAGGGGGGAVDSVNGKTGDVVLDAADVGTLTEAEIETAIAAADGVNELGFLHLTNLDISSPHPFGAFITEGALPLQLAGQTNPAENGTYTWPADPTTEPIVPVDAGDELLQVPNAGKIVTFGITIGASTVASAYQYQVYADATEGVRIALQNGALAFAQWRYTGDPSAATTITGASAGQVVLVTDQDDNLYDGGLWLYVAAGQPLARCGIFAPTGSRVFVMTEDEDYTLTPHSGWIPSSLSGRVDTLETEMDAVEADVSALQVDDAEYGISALGSTGPQAWFTHNGSTTGRLSTPNPGALSSGLMVRAVTMLTGVPGGGNRFGEIFSSALDGGAGAWDGFELADHLNDAGSFDNSVIGGETNEPDYIDQWVDYWESTAYAESTEEDIQLLTPSMKVRAGLWLSRMTTIDFASGTYRVWREVLHGGDAVTTDTGQRWALIRTVVDERFDSIVQDEAWWVGNNYPGRTSGVTVNDGYTEDGDEITPGTLVANPHPSQWTPGDSTFTDDASNVWTLNSATVAYSDDARLDTLEAAPTVESSDSSVTDIRVLTQAAYDAIGTPDATTLYFIEDA